MVRAPTKTCPNLSRLFENAEAAPLADFLASSAFELLRWLDKYKFERDDPAGPGSARAMLEQEKKERLSPLENEAARIATIAGGRGQYALDGVARTKLDTYRLRTLQGQRDEMARSLWAFTNENALFEAAENSLHLRLYRRYDKHYQTFLVEPSGKDGQGMERLPLESLLAELSVKLDRGEGYDIDRFDIPEDGEEPAAEMYMLFHPDPPTSVRDMDEEGNRSRIYFRPPGEAMIVYTPTTGRVHVRAGTRQLRHVIAESFIEDVLDLPMSHQPVDFQAYDIARFFEGFDLSLPEFEDVTILGARVIRAEISIGNLANRLSLTTTLSQDLTEIIDGQPGLRRTFERAVAIRFIEIAVRYRRAGRDGDETLDFTLTDRNTSSLLSLDDPFERVLGHRLLRYWEILQDGRSPSEGESMAALPALLALWDIGAKRVTGAWLHDRGIDPNLLTEVGFLVPAGWEEEDLIDGDDDLGSVDAEVVMRPEGPGLKPTEGQEAPAGAPERYRVYRVRDGWVVQHLRERVVNMLDVLAVEELSTNILALGTLRIDGREVPVYLARGLDDERMRAGVDTELRARSHQGMGLVLQAGKTFGVCLAANVLTPLIDHIAGELPEILLDPESLRAVFRRNRALASGGQTVELRRAGANAGTLLVPGRGTIDILGANRVLVIERLVGAHNNGPAPMTTGQLSSGMDGQSLANIFGPSLWEKLKADFIRSPKKGLWEIAA